MSLITLPGFEQLSQQWPLVAEGYRRTDAGGNMLDARLAVVDERATDRAYLESAKEELNRWTEGSELEDAFFALLTSAPSYDESTQKLALQTQAKTVALILSTAEEPALREAIDTALVDLGEQSPIEAFFTQETAGLPTWAWFAIGAGVLLLLIVLMAVVLRTSGKRSTRSAQQQRMNLLAPRYAQY
jgi:hypothetical protein